MPELDVEQSDGVATVVLSRPAAMNALSKSLRRELVQTFAELAADTGVRVVILTGAGDRAFCAGLDLKELGADGRALDGVAGRADEFNPSAPSSGVLSPSSAPSTAWRSLAGSSWRSPAMC
jgi:enoyl-CoA hydratase